jgi:hypothetical protein
VRLHLYGWNSAPEGACWSAANPPANSISHQLKVKWRNEDQ